VQDRIVAVCRREEYHLVLTEPRYDGAEGGTRDAEGRDDVARWTSLPARGAKREEIGWSVEEKNMTRAAAEKVAQQETETLEENVRIERRDQLAPGTDERGRDLRLLLPFSLPAPPTSPLFAR
jgi:hypothetical protein